jgi:hypothetical protein
MLKRKLGHALKASICTCVFAVTLPFLSESAYCQNPTAKAHDPSPEELKILRAAAVSQEFNLSDGPNLRVCLMHSEDRECNTGSFGERAASPEAGSQEPSDWIRPAACAADVVALGRVVGQTSPFRK